MAATRVFATLLILCMCSMKLIIFKKYNDNRLNNNHNEVVSSGVSELHIVLVRR